MAREELAQLQSIHGDWTVEQGWRHYFAGGHRGGHCNQRLDHLEPLPDWQETDFFPYYKFDFPEKPARNRPRKKGDDTLTETPSHRE
ncbi:MAG TPA: hypothetical protein VGM98_08565 [Schlesneria sp.]